MRELAVIDTESSRTAHQVLLDGRVRCLGIHHATNRIAAVQTYNGVGTDHAAVHDQHRRCSDRQVVDVHVGREVAAFWVDDSVPGRLASTGFNRNGGVQIADDAVCIGPAPAAESYLNIDAIIQAAKQTGADAIHPGYGFLAENTDFDVRCEKEGITFIGPNSKSLDLVGDKVRSRQTMEKAGIPIIPGMKSVPKDIADYEKEAQRIGYPVMIKASARQSCFNGSLKMPLGKICPFPNGTAASNKSRFRFRNRRIC